jgi:hypothetical protein
VVVAVEQKLVEAVEAVDYYTQILYQLVKVIQNSQLRELTHGLRLQELQPFVQYA